MAKRKKEQSEPLPIRSSSQIKEDDSKIIFENTIRPWMIASWIQRDFGIDAIIEITKPISNSKDQIVTGKRFSVQLKSTDTAEFDKQTFSLSIPKEKISYWYSAIEPVLLVYIDLKTEYPFYRWIDETLIKELFQQNSNWIAQQTISIKFEKNIFIDSKQLLAIEKYVVHWKRPSKTILTPGNYFKYSTEAKGYIDSLAETKRNFNISCLDKEFSELNDAAVQIIYTIAVVGPSRAGKSTLINSLLHKSVSPVGILPTTGIPITIFPKGENKTIVLFKNGEQITGSIESSFIEEYTSQDQNPNNEKKVNLVSIHIINSLLEKGFALCDVPGLDDPDTEIRSITKSALYNVNAIIYVINTASMRDGGFSITKQIVDDLNDLGGKMDKLFLVFNKVDVLEDEQRKQLEDYVNNTLQKFNITQYLPVPPIYISSKNSFENRIKYNNTNDTVGLLEKHLWEFLLSHNKTGLHKILGTYADLRRLIEKHKNIVNARLLDSEKRISVETQIEQVRNEIKEIRKFVLSQRLKIYSNLREYLQNSFENILRYLEKDLATVPLKATLPSISQISTWLENNAYKTMSDVYENLNQYIYELQSEINQWISQKLNQVELSLETTKDKDSFNLPEITIYTGQLNLHFRDKETGFVGMLESMFWVMGSLFVNILETIEILLTPVEKLRNKQIKELVTKSRKGYNKIAADFMVNLNTYLNKVCRIMEEKSIDRTRVYLGELSIQLNKLDKQISAKEKTEYQNFISEVSKIENGVESNFIHLKDYTDGIDWLR